MCNFKLNSTKWVASLYRVFGILKGVQKCKFYVTVCFKTLITGVEIKLDEISNYMQFSTKTLRSFMCSISFLIKNDRELQNYHRFNLWNLYLNWLVQ